MTSLDPSDEGGARPSGTGSREPGLASRPGPAGFDPARFERIVHFSPAHDDFDPVKRTGSRGFMRITFILKGSLGATQFMVGTAWGLPRSDGSTHRLIASNTVDPCRPTGYDVGYHSPVALYDGQTAMECDLLPGGRCFYDGSGLRADEWVPDFIAGGSDWVWQKLEEEYADLFASADRSGEAGEASTQIEGSTEGESAVPANSGETPTPKSKSQGQVP